MPERPQLRQWREWTTRRFEIDSAATIDVGLDGETLSSSHLSDSNRSRLVNHGEGESLHRGMAPPLHERRLLPERAAGAPQAGELGGDVSHAQAMFAVGGPRHGSRSGAAACQQQDGPKLLAKSLLALLWGEC